MKLYVVTKMLEQDFGCEGIPEGKDVEIDVFLRDEEGNTLEVTIPDAELIRKDINEGDWVGFTAEGEIVKE